MVKMRLSFIDSDFLHQWTFLRQAWLYFSIVGDFH